MLVFGQCSQTQSLTNSPTRLINNWYPATFVPIALASCGKISQAQIQINKLKEKYPQGTLVIGIWIPMFNAQIELEKDNPREAIRLLEEERTLEGQDFIMECRLNRIERRRELRLSKLKKTSFSDHI